MSWFSRKKHAPEVEAYLDATPKRLNRKQPLDELYFIAIDAETTGFDVTKDRILSLAAVPLRGRQLNLADMQGWLVFQDRAKVNDAARIHGILPSDTRLGQPESEVMDELLPLLKGAVIVGHHVGFDAAMIDHALRRRFGVGLRNPLVDTAALAQIAVDAFARTGYVNQRPPTLDELCSHLEIATVERHTAAGDAFTTAELFMLLCARLRQQRKRPLTAGDLPVEYR